MSQGLDAAIESYSGLLTVDAPDNGNMFFWFFPAAENPETAPVVIWLQVTANLKWHDGPPLECSLPAQKIFIMIL